MNINKIALSLGIATINPAAGLVTFGLFALASKNKKAKKIMPKRCRVCGQFVSNMHMHECPELKKQADILNKIQTLKIELKNLV